MEQGTYAAASGGLVQLRKLEVLNNNLANMNTVGFKRQYLVNQEQAFSDTFTALLKVEDPYAKGDHDRVHGATSIRTMTDFSQGPIRTTGEPFDVALQDPRDFFAVTTPEGTLYTRAGNFTLDVEGNLVTPDGAKVQGDGGPIVVNLPGGTIGPDGTIIANRIPVARLQVFRFADPNGLERVGETRFRLPAGSGNPTTVEPMIVPGALEMANVSPVTGVVDLITTSRAFEAYTKAAMTIDQMNQAAITQVARR
jgi:flagellar basal-body rod protein FlgG